MADIKKIAISSAALFAVCICFVLSFWQHAAVIAASSNNAQLVSQSVPTTMVAGQTYSVSVTMKNTGTTTWTKTNGYCLGSQNPQDNRVWHPGVRVYLASTDSIAPGQSKTFTFTAKAPTIPGTYNFQWQMLQESVQWFGAKSTNVAVKVVSAPICTPQRSSGCKVCNSTGTSWVDTDSKCPSGQTCQSGVCKAPCVPKTCSSLGYKCGSASDGCGKTLNCGTCPSGQTCQSGTCVNLNVAKQFFGRINLDYKGLEKVKAAVAKSDYGTAEKEFVTYMKNRISPNYFFDHKERVEIANLINTKFPTRKDAYTSSADVYLKHEFDLSGTKMTLGSNINWRACGTKVECASVLNRFGWLKYLGRAYWFSGNEKYAKEFVSITNDWINDNRVPTYQTRNGVEPWESLSSTVRIMSMIEGYNYFCDSANLNVDFHMKFFSSVYDHGNYLRIGVSKDNYSGVGNNWAIFEAQGLATVALMFPEFKDASQWRKAAFDLLKNHAAKEFYSDGAYIEITPGYHNSMVLAYLSIYQLAQKNGISFSISDATFKEMFYWLAKLQNPARKIPSFADSGYSTEGNYRNTLARGALVFNDPVLKYLSLNSANEEMLWYHGKNVFDDYASISKKEPSFKSVKTANTQLIVMRTGWANTDKYLFFDCAPFGSSGHSHSDALNVAAYSGSTAIITDSGVCSYDDPAAQYYQSYRAHNVAVINGNDNYGYKVFGQPAHANPNINSFITNTNYDFASCSMDNQRRQILFIKPDYWIIYDTISSSSRSIDLLFHNPDNNFSKITSLDGISSRSINQSVSGTSLSPLLNGKYIAYSKNNAGPISLATMLYSDIAADGITKSALKVSENGKTLSSDKASGYKIFYKDKDGKTVIDYVLFSATASKKQFGELSFSGTTGFVRDNASGYQFLMINGAEFNYGGLKINLLNKKLTVISPKSVTGTFCGLVAESVIVNGKSILTEKDGNCLTFTVKSEPPCTNECSTFGAKQCSGTTGYKTCGNYDPDSCLEWSSVTKCPTGQTCSSGVCQTTCTPKTCASLKYACGSASDGCGKTLNCGTCASGKICNANKCVVCVPNTVSGCKVCKSDGSAWVDTDSKCASGQKCQNGVCVAICTPTCTTSGAKQCSGTASYQICALSGGCLKWGAATACPTGQTCSGTGVCKTRCTPKTCSSLGYTCGTASDGCGKTLNCGTCASGKVCVSGKCLICTPNSVSGCKVCKSDGSAWVDTDSKCASGQKCQNGVCVAKYECTPYQINGCAYCAADGSGWLDDNSKCDNGKKCSFGKCVTSCTNECTTSGAKQCSGNGVQTCTMPSDCLKWSSAVACPTGQTCSGAGVCAVSCASDSNSTFCLHLGKNCGSITANDNCGTSRTVNCGTCASGYTCTANKCTLLCTPKTCVTLGNYNCGSWSDGCGKTLNCGTCATGKTCSNGACVASCTSHSSKKCDNGNLYWYNSCNTKEELAQNCSTDEITSNYQCSGTWTQRETIKKGCQDNVCTSQSIWNNIEDCSTSNKTCLVGSCAASSSQDTTTTTTTNMNTTTNTDTTTTNTTTATTNTNTNTDTVTNTTITQTETTNTPILTKPINQMTRAEVLQKIAQIKQLLIQLIAQLIIELQKQLAASHS